MFPIKFKMLTIQVETRERKKKFFFCPEIWGDLFAAFDFFRNEEKNKGEEAKGGEFVCKEAGVGQDRDCIAHESLINLCLGCWKLFLGYACKGHEMGAE